jgi:hypothetical protein
MKNWWALLILLLSVPVLGQTDLESDIDSALQNAKKGVYWALNNIPEKKIKLDNDLILNNQLCSSVKLSKEINGLKIESTGFHNSYTVTIKLFRSDDNLINDGYIKPKETKEVLEEGNKITK